jgi:hypothetical protein
MRFDEKTGFYVEIDSPCTSCGDQGEPVASHAVDTDDGTDSHRVTGLDDDLFGDEDPKRTRRET